ncbi:MAG: methylmalonyl Co-A mutase-associated GTPase MeaB [Thermoleophilia bacterium]
MTTGPGLEELVRDARDGRRRAVGRLITLVERDAGAADAIAALLPPGEAHIVGITGPPGAGKSSFTARLLGIHLAAGRNPAVLAVDPSSPITGGAILGDRVRMTGAAEDAFVRSMATRGQQGGLSRAVPAAARLLARLGFDPVIVETTGVGQAEVDIAAAADTTVLITAPGWGDAVQANKAGLLELADVLVVNKADRDGAAGVRRDLELMLELGRISGLEERRGHRPRIVLTTSTTGEGVDEAAAAIDAHRELIAASGVLDGRRERRVALEIMSSARDRLEACLASAVQAPAMHDTLAAVREGRLTAAQGAADLMRRVGEELLAAERPAA